MLSAAVIVSDQSGKSFHRLLRKTDQVTWNGICYTRQNGPHQKEKASAVLTPEIIVRISDLLIILDPDYCTFDYLSGAVRNGCHLFLTDRLRMTTHERKELIQLADEGGTSIQIRNDLLFHPFRDKISAEPILPGFIEIHQVSPHQSDNYQEILFNNLLMTLRITGSHIHRLNVFGGNGQNNKTDLINLYISFINGSAASITISFAGDKNEHQLSVYKNGQLLRFDFEKNSAYQFPSQIDFNYRQNSDSDPLTEQINDFIEKISNHCTPLFSLKDEATVFHLLEKIKSKLEARSVLI
jgi:hypothetical protein